MRLGISSLLCQRTKLRGSPKALTTKLLRETSIAASLMTEDTVISLKILVIEMGDRGSKSVIFDMITVKEQRVDGSSYSISLDCVRYTLVTGKSGSCLHYLNIIYLI